MCSFHGHDSSLVSESFYKSTWIGKVVICHLVSFPVQYVYGCDLKVGRSLRISTMYIYRSRYFWGGSLGQCADCVLSAPQHGERGAEQLSCRAVGHFSPLHSTVHYSKTAVSSLPSFALLQPRYQRSTKSESHISSTQHSYFATAFPLAITSPIHISHGRPTQQTLPTGGRQVSS